MEPVAGGLWVSSPRFVGVNTPHIGYHSSLSSSTNKENRNFFQGGFAFDALWVVSRIFSSKTRTETERAQVPFPPPIPLCRSATLSLQISNKNVHPSSKTRIKPSSTRSSPNPDTGGPVIALTAAQGVSLLIQAFADPGASSFGP